MDERSRINLLPKRSRSTSLTVAKFLGPFRHLKTHFRQFYHRCTCHVAPTPPAQSPAAEPNLVENAMTMTLTSLESSKDCGVQSVPSTCEEFHQINEHLKPNQELVWYNCETGISVVKGMILPSPPQTPLFHPDGDFLFQVIPPPLEYQDKYPNSRPVNTLRHFNQSGDAGVFQSRSGTSVNSIINPGTEDYRQPLTFSAFTKYTTGATGGAMPSMTRPDPPKSRAGFSLNDSVYRNSGYCKITSMMFQGKKGIKGFLNDSALEDFSVTWKELPKSISLNINSGFIKSMFIPSWSNYPLRKAPFFVPVSKVINWSAIDIRKERVASRQRKQTELRKRQAHQRREIWKCRNQIGHLRRMLKPESASLSIPESGDAKNDINNKFQLIHWISEKESGLNSTGRYFDVDEKRLVTIKISPANPPSNVYERTVVTLEALKEINALKKLEHVNIIELISYFEYMEKIYLVFEACDHSLRCEIACAGGGVDPKMVHGVVYQIVSGLDHCHKKSLLHRSLSPDTILVTVEGTIKISDFSKSVFLKGQQEKPKPCLPGDIKYGAPELLAQDTLDTMYGLSADIWSVGCILVELILGKLLWNGSTAEEQLKYIHNSVGPLLPQHAKAAGMNDGIFTGQSLRDFFPDNCEKVLPVIELCLEVDFCKRVACRGLLAHPFVKRGSHYSQHAQGEATLPRMALWEMRPYTVPIEKLSSETQLESPRKSDPEVENSSSLHPPPLLRTKTAVKKPRVTVVFPHPQEPSKEKADGTLSIKNECQTQQIVFQEVAKEQLFGVGTKYFWKNLNDFAADHKNFSGTSIQESSPILRKGSEVRKTEGRNKPLENVISNSDGVSHTLCDRSESNEITQCLPNGPKSRMQYLINSIPNASWSTVQVFTDHLVHSAKKNPKTFSNNVGQLVTVLLDQISDTKSKVAGPSIRILNNICEYNGNLFEPEAERIIESMLNKLGGPSFIEKESNDVLRNLTNALKPYKAILSLIKYGLNHKISAARQSTVLLVEHSMKQVDLISSFGLPGEQSAAQRRFATSVFEVATRFLRDSNSQTRSAARGIYQLLMRHPGFWYLYQSAVTEEKRHWVNRMLDEIRRFPTIERKGLKTAVKTPCNNNYS